ncbi:sigma 54-interacting transcriptional regulator [Candidatus Aerophobetes bacterium]|nr:sigma 54-interacting transcriptional regulator [Candidatus Aerophobetes bacterium]
MKIGFVAPYPALAILAKKLQTQFPIEIEEGDLKEGLKKAIRLQKKGVKAIVTRGGTALLIKSSPQVYLPVIEIRVTGYDLLEALIKAKNLKGKTAIIGFSNVISGGRKIAKCLNLNISYFEIEDEGEVDRYLFKVKELGIKNVIGDHVVVEKTGLYGMNPVLIESGEEAVKAALEEAKNTVIAVEEEVKKAKRYKTILDSIHEGIIVLDENKKISVVNRQVESLLGIEENLILNKKLSSVLKGLDIKDVWRKGKRITGCVVKAKGRELVANVFPVKIEKKVSGVVINLTPLKVLQNTEIKVRKNLYSSGLVAGATFEDITQKSRAIKDVIKKAKKYAATNLTILITGETGTGKDILAQSIHNYSLLRDNPFVAINCAALPESLLEMELFGYEEGAFTDAKKGGKPGLFELAHRGTIFLDEIAEMPLSLQNRLLRVIEEKRVRRIGGTKFIPVDVRIITATNKDLWKMVEEGKFREDLYYRVNVLHIHLPPLRERKEDIIPIFKETVSNLSGNGFTEINFEKICEELKDILLGYGWPGNIRELINFAQRLFFLSEGFKIREEKLKYIAISELEKRERSVAIRKNDVFELLKGGFSLRDVENRILLEYALEKRKSGKSISEIAKELGISRTTLWKRLKNMAI